jgi:hypothetical protein
VDKMDKQKSPSARDLSHKGGQPSQGGQQAKSGQTMPPGGSQTMPPPKGTQPTHTGNK